MSLETWAINHKTKIIVISSDNDWNNFCKNSKHLVAINDFGQALGLFQLQNADDICEYLSERYERDGLENLQDHILNSLNHHITNIDFSLSPGSDFLYEEELEGVTINKFEFNLFPSLNTIFRPISLNDDFLVVESNLSVNVSIDYIFSFYVRDYIDKDYVPMGSKGITVEKNLDINILISFIGDLNNVGGKIEVHNIEFESATFEFKDEDIDLDYINPDFEPDLDDYL